MEELTGTKITDIHRERFFILIEICKFLFFEVRFSVDHLTIPSKTGHGTLKRISEVFDCWFESGSMPYAQQHYPFENAENFNNRFPADFVAEGKFFL